ncbi:hypothetical protein JOM56_001583 [Amanita muscaria]
MSWRVVCFPLILWVANILCVVNWITNYTLWVFVSEVPYHQRMTVFLRVYYCCNFVTNFYATSVFTTVLIVLSDTYDRRYFLSSVVRRKSKCQWKPTIVYSIPHMPRNSDNGLLVYLH